MGLFDHISGDATLKLHRRGSQGHTPIDLAAQDHTLSTHGSMEERESEVRPSSGRTRSASRLAHIPGLKNDRRSLSFAVVMLLAVIALVGLLGFSAWKGQGAEDGIMEAGMRMSVYSLFEQSLIQRPSQSCSRSTVLLLAICLRCAGKISSAMIF